jgi:hypothetical protein
MVAEFVAAYRKDPKLAAIMDEIRKPTKKPAKPTNRRDQRAEPTNEDIGILFRASYPFHIAKKNGLLYHRRIDGTYALCIPRGMVGTILATAYDESHYYGRDRMLYELRYLAIHCKTHQVKQHINHYLSCRVNANDYSMPPGVYQPILPNAANALPMRVINLDFIVKLPVISAQNSPWKMPNREQFDTLLTVTDKATK